MDKAAPGIAEPKTAAEYRAAIEDMLAEMQRMHECSEQTWIEIERIKGESKAIRVQTDQIVDRINARLDAIEALRQLMWKDCGLRSGDGGGPR